MIKDFKYGNIFLDSKGAKNTKYNYYNDNSIIGYDKFDYVDYLDSNRPLKDLNEQYADFHEVFKSLIRESAFSRKIVYGCDTPVSLAEDWQNDVYLDSTEIDDRTTDDEILPFIVPKDFDSNVYTPSLGCYTNSYILEPGVIADVSSGDFYRVGNYMNYVEQGLAKIIDIDTSVNTRRKGFLEFGITGTIEASTLLGLSEAVGTEKYVITFETPDITFSIEPTITSTTTVQDFIVDITTKMNEVLDPILGHDNSVSVGLNSYNATYKDIAIYYNEYLSTLKGSYIHLVANQAEIGFTLLSIYNGGIFGLSDTSIQRDAVYNDLIKLEVGDTKRYKINIIRNAGTVDPLSRYLENFEFDRIEELYDKLIDNSTPRSDFNVEDTYDISDALYLKLENRFLIKQDDFNFVVYNRVTNKIEVYTSSANKTQTDFDNKDTDTYILLYNIGDDNTTIVKQDIDLTGITKIINNTYIVPDIAGRTTISGAYTPLNIGDRVFQEDTAVFYRWNGSVLIQEV